MELPPITSTIPILLLKTKSTPTDAYADHLSRLQLTISSGIHHHHHYHGGESQYQKEPSSSTATTSSSSATAEAAVIVSFAPHNVPVLEHVFKSEGLCIVERLLRNKAFGDPKEEKIPEQAGQRQQPLLPPLQRYGGIIFTSQRAVDAFLQVLHEIAGSLS